MQGAAETRGREFLLLRFRVRMPTPHPLHTLHHRAEWQDMIRYRYGPMIWEMTVSIRSSPISIWDILSLFRREQDNSVTAYTIQAHVPRLPPPSPLPHPPPPPTSAPPPPPPITPLSRRRCAWAPNMVIAVMLQRK